MEEDQKAFLGRVLNRVEAICEREMSRGKEQAQACIEAILVKRSDAASAHFTREGRRPILKHALVLLS